MASDREAELRIKATADFSAAQEAAAKLGQEVQQLGTSSDSAASGLNETANAANTLATAETATAEAAEQAGQAIREAGDQAAQDAQEGASAAREQAQALGTVSDGYRAMGAALRDSGASLEVQKVGLQSIISEVQELTNSYIAAGNAEEANLAGDTLITLKAKLAEVNAEISEEIKLRKRTGDEAESASAKIAAALDAIKSREVTVEDATLAAAAALEKVNTNILENGKISLKAFGNAAEAVELFRQTVISTRGSLEAATKDEIAILNRLETELAEVTKRAQALNNAAKDNAVGLKETGDKVAGLAFGIQNLTQLMGPGAQQFGILAANAGLLASTSEGLKDSIAEMGFNTSVFGTSATSAGIATVGLTAALAGGVAAGLKFAESSNLNKEALDDFKESVSTLATETLGGLISRLGAGQEAWQTYFAEILTFDPAKPIASFDRIGNATVGLEVAMRKGGAAANVYYDLLNNGFDILAARSSITNASRQDIELYTRAHELGARGIVLWNEAVRNSGGTAQGLARELKVLKINLDEEAKLSAVDAEEKKKLAAAKKDAAAATRDETAALKEYKTASQEANDTVTQAGLDVVVLERAHKGTTAAITQGVEAIKNYIGTSDQNSVALGKLAAALQDVLSKTDGLTKAERERIQAVIDAAKNANDLTTAEQARAKTLIDQIANETAATKALQEKKTALEQSAEAHAVSTQAQVEATAASAAFAAATEAEATVIRASAETMAADAQRKRELADLTRSLSNENLAYGEASRKTSEIVKDGAHSYTNLNEEQQKVSEGTVALVRDLETGKTTITNVGSEAAKTKGHLTELNETVTTGSTAFQGLVDVTKDLPDSFAALAEAMPVITAGMREAIETARQLAESMRDVKQATDAASASASSAAGDQIGPRDVAGDF